jgi:hypothetical protein
VFGPEAWQGVAGVLGFAPLIAENLKKRRVKIAMSSPNLDIYREAGYSWSATVIYGVLLMVAAVSITGFISGYLLHSWLRSFLPAHLITAAAGLSVLPAVFILYFLIGKLFALCRSHRWWALAAVILLGPLTLRVIDFLILPDSWFDAVFPLLDRTMAHFTWLLAWTIAVFAVPVTLGALWYARRAIPLRVAAALRMLPRETQVAVADLVHDELRRGMLASLKAASGQR